MDDDAIKDLLAGIYIQQLRIYDLLAVIAYNISKDSAKVNELLEQHEAGKVLCPDPALVLEDED